MQNEPQPQTIEGILGQHAANGNPQVRLLYTRTFVHLGVVTERLRANNLDDDEFSIVMCHLTKASVYSAATFMLTGNRVDNVDGILKWVQGEPEGNVETWI
jgi:hypothetical protein